MHRFVFAKFSGFLRMLKLIKKIVAILIKDYSVIIDEI